MFWSNMSMTWEPSFPPVVGGGGKMSYNFSNVVTGSAMSFPSTYILRRLRNARMLAACSKN